MKIYRIKKIKNKDIRGLAYMLHGLAITTKCMKRANIEFVVSKFNDEMGKI